ncbi:mechanosensitive ion channel [Francisella sp. Scap27]|uniref:mechanosensitive ion channel domain-containing protein n=1 Tax=Francisella sp. Scap27 TaxID=2589986 RepID=UPI0015BAF879|nr:mechanosensitive ion channel domain-containing protein [Francisella sp. Scap27]QLE78913.1 mechanosensitive ion channel [Francisella sp. Scap27]
MKKNNYIIKLLFCFLVIFCSFTSIYASDFSIQQYIKQTAEVMRTSSKLETYVQNSYEQKNLSDEKLSDYKVKLLEQYDKLTLIENALETKIKQTKDSLREYISLDSDKNKGSFELSDNFLYKVVAGNKPSKENHHTEQNYKDIDFDSNIIQKRYQYLVESYLETKQALSYVGDVKKTLSKDLKLILDTRIKIRNRDFFTKGAFLGHYSSWEKGLSQIEYKISFISLLKYLFSIALVFVIYKVCSIAFYISLKLVRLKFSRYRVIISSLSFFLRVFWNVLIATVLVLILGKLFEYHRIEEFFAAYTICVYFILQNSLVIFLRFLKVSPGNKVQIWLKSYVFILMLLIFLQGVNFFSAVTIIQPVFGLYGNIVVTFIISIMQLFIAYIIYFQLGKLTHRNKKLNILRMALIIFSLIYCVLTFMGLNSLATLLMVNFLQIFVVAIISHSMYSVIVILLHYIASKTLHNKGSQTSLINRLKNQEKETLPEYWVRTIIKMIFIVIAIVISLVILGIPYQEIRDFFYTIFFTGIRVGGTNYFAIAALLKSLLVILIGLSLSKVVERVFAKNILPYTMMGKGTQKAISTAVWYMGLFLSIIFFIASMGISGTALAFIVSGLSVGVGFALQDLMKNFFAGFMMLVERPIRIGDYVMLDGILNEVKKIRLRSTIVQDFNLNTIVVPNSQFMNSSIKNETYNPLSRMNLKISVNLNQDVEQIFELLMSITKTYKGIVNYPEPFVIFEGYSEYTLDFTLRAYCLRVDRLVIESNLRQAIVKEFERLGIEIPINTSKVILDK